MLKGAVTLFLGLRAPLSPCKSLANLSLCFMLFSWTTCDGSKLQLPKALLNRGGLDEGRSDTLQLQNRRRAGSSVLLLVSESLDITGMVSLSSIGGPMETQVKYLAITRGSRTATVKSFIVFALLATCIGYSREVAIANTAGSQDSRIVGTRVDVGPTDRELTLTFTVTPSIRFPPVVRLLGTAARAKTLEVQSDSPGHYSAHLGDIQDVSAGQLLLEISNSQKERHELHSADFVLHEIPTGPSSSPSRDGHLVLYTKPAGISRGSRILISSGERPIDALPGGVSSTAVMGAYFIDSLASFGKAEGWQLAIATVPGSWKVTLFYLAKGSKTWKPLESNLIPGHPLQACPFAGQGTYLLVRGTKQ